MVQNSALLYPVVQEVVKVEVPTHLDLVQLASSSFIFFFFEVFTESGGAGLGESVK